MSSKQTLEEDVDDYYEGGEEEYYDDEYYDDEEYYEEGDGDYDYVDKYDDYDDSDVPMAVKEKPKAAAKKPQAVATVATVSASSSGGGKESKSGSNSNSNRASVNVFTAATLTSRDEISDDDMADLTSAPVGLDHMTVVVAGHVDAGKSTLVGNLMFKSGAVSKEVIHKNQKEASVAGKGSFGVAWLADESASERAHGVTIDISEKYLKTATREYTILDAPGHRDYIPNMISGTALADVALFVIPSSKGEYETAISYKSQTREHAVLLKALGVKFIIIVVNKFDTIEFSKVNARFTQITTEIRQMLLELQFKGEQIFEVPVIANSGENLVSISDPTSPISPWYHGKSLLQILDDIPTQARDVNRPLRAILTSVIGELPKGCDMNVKVVQGRLRINRRLYISGSSSAGDGRIFGAIKRITRADGSSVNTLYAGETGQVRFIDSQERKGEDLNLRQGFLLYKGLPHVRCCLKIRAIISTLDNLSAPIIPGTPFLFYLNGDEVQCKITKLYRVNVKSTAVVKRPKSVGASKTAAVRIEFDRHICIEPFESCRSLGRFALRSNGETCAIGICEKTPKLL